MAFRVEVRAARHAVAQQHLRLPINVLLALPEIRENTAVEQLFNLPSAINLLLGSEGWYRATRVMRPMLLAPDWDNDVLHAFLSNAPLSPNRGPMDVNRLVEERIFGYMLKPGKVDPTTPRFAIRHYAAAGGANQGDAVGWMPVFPSDREAPILGTLARGEGRFIEAFDEMTRLVILQRPYGFIDSWARDFAGSLVKQGGPAVLIVAATDPLQAHAYLVDVYAGIIHNRPLQEAVAPRTPYPIEIEFWHGKGSEHLLTFDGWLNELRVGIESLRSRHAGFTKDLSNRTQNASPYLHRTTLQRITMDVESTRDEIAARLDTLDHKLDFARETRGVFPLLDMSDNRSDAESSVPGLYPDLEITLGRQLDQATSRAPRVMNVNFAERHWRAIVPPDTALAEGAPYNLLVDVGPRGSTVPSIVHGNSDFPERAVTPRAGGFALHVVLVSEDFSPPMSSGWMWLPGGAGRSVPYDSKEIPVGKTPRDRPKQKKPGPLIIPVVTPKFRKSEANLQKRYSARLSIYYEGNLIQSAAVNVTVARNYKEARLEQPNEAQVDYSLTGSFVQVDDLFGQRLLSPPEAKTLERQPVSVNLTLNDAGDAGHRIIINGRPEAEVPPPGWVQYNASSSVEILDAARQSLLGCFFSRDAEGRIDPKSNGLDADNGKAYEQFLFDLRGLCRTGDRLFKNAFHQIKVANSAMEPADWVEMLTTALSRKSVIQIARTVKAEYSFPWALMYDIPLSGGPAKFCHIVERWKNKGVQPMVEDCCPYADDADHQEDVYCPYGLWGLKHIIEQPLPQLISDQDDPQIAQVKRVFAQNSDIALAVAVTRDQTLDLPRMDMHIGVVSGLPRVKLCPPSPAQETTGVRQAVANTDVVYFLCHGSIEANPPPPHPTLGTRPQNGGPPPPPPSWRAGASVGAA